MAKLYRRADSEYWYADYKDAADNRIQRCTYQTRKSDAQLRADTWERESLRDPVAAAREAATWGHALDLLAAHLLEQVSAGRMAHPTALAYRAKAVQLTKYFPKVRKLSTFGTAAVRDYCAHRRQPRAELRADGSTRERPGVRDHTLVKELVVLKLALRLAKERRLWSGDLDTLKPADVSSDYTPRERVVSPTEVDLLRAELGPRKHRKRIHWRAVAFALATGAEPSTWPKVRRADVITQGHGDDAVTLVHLRGTKRETRDRWVPVLLPECQALLAEALEGPDEAPPYLLRPWPKAGQDIARACERARIGHVTPTDLRRTWATRHIEAGVSLDVLFRFMGHADTTMLARTYAKPAPLVQAELARGQIERKKGPPKP